MSKKEECIAVVVTHNRPKLLLKVIESLSLQTYPLKKIIVIDNDSEISAHKIIKDTKNIDIVRFKNNLGGSAGFKEGIKKALVHDPDWVWLMDDDACPFQNALEKIMSIKSQVTLKSKVGAFCSSVIEGDHQAYYHQKNFDWKFGTTFPLSTNIQNKEFVKVDIASFVGLLLNKKAIIDIGLPISKFFITHDDMEYSLRLRSFNYFLYLIPSSKIKHSLKKQPHVASNFGERHYFEIRNHILVIKKYSSIKFAAVVISIFRSLRILRLSKNKFNIDALKLYLKAICHGLFKKAADE